MCVCGEKCVCVCVCVCVDRGLSMKLIEQCHSA